MKKLAIITTHPIQYYAPVFELLYARGQINSMVFYTWGPDSISKFDPGFNKEIKWDIPLLNGYAYEWVKNESKDPGTHHFNGIINPNLIEQVKHWQPDAILIYGWGFNSHLKLIRYFKNKIPVLFRGDSTLLDQKTGIKSVIRTIFLTWVYHYIDHALYPGINSKGYFKKYGLKNEQLSFAPHAIDNKRFAENKSSEALQIRQNLLIEYDKLVILFAGKLEEKKAPVQLLEAFLRTNNLNAHLLFVGNGPLETQLKAMAGKSTNVHFVDFQNQLQMPAVYQACDIFCLPSIGPGETWGLAINEAMASGTAVLASDKCGAAIDLVKHYKNGEIFKAGESMDLIDKLEKLLHSGKKALVEMGTNSKLIIESYTFEKQVTVIEEIVNNG